jgi:hypothetical protein
MQGLVGPPLSVLDLVVNQVGFPTSATGVCLGLLGNKEGRPSYLVPGPCNSPFPQFTGSYIYCRCLLREDTSAHTQNNWKLRGIYEHLGSLM